MPNITKLLSILILAALLSGCATLANLTGTRGCECSYNEQTGITKWSCASGATSESAAISFKEKCQFQAQAKGAEVGQAILNQQLIEGMARAILERAYAPEGQ